jgi:3-oxoacyl-[acyl-carrier-protein] synthase II
VSQTPRIVITGVGLHTGHGDTNATWTALCESRSALTCDHAWRAPLPEQSERDEPATDGQAFPIAPAPEPTPVEFLADRKMVKYMGPCTQMAVLAAGRALRDAGLLDASGVTARAAMGLFVATGPIAFDIEQMLASFDERSAEELVALRGDGMRRCHPLLPFKMLLNMPLGLVSIVFGIKGPNFILYPGAEQGAAALAHALRGLRQGRFARALVGGSACSLGLSPILHLRRTGRLAWSVAQANPFAAQHAGWAPADQAAFLVLEREEQAARRGRDAYASLDQLEVLGADADARLWAALAGTPPPDVAFCTGSLTAAEPPAYLARVREIWSRPAMLASADGLLGVAPAASFLLHVALACLCLRQGNLPAALTERGSGGPVVRAMIAFRDTQGVAAARLAGSLARGAA